MTHITVASSTRISQPCAAHDIVYRQPTDSLPSTETNPKSLSYTVFQKKLNIALLIMCLPKTLTIFQKKIFTDRCESKFAADDKQCKTQLYVIIFTSQKVYKFTKLQHLIVKLTFRQQHSVEQLQFAIRCFNSEQTVIIH